MPSIRILLFATAVSVLAVFVACGGDDSNDDSSGTGSVTPTASGGTPDPSATVTTAPTPGGDPLVPPLEGTEIGAPVTEMTDWREETGWQMPDPGQIPAAEDSDDPILNPPEDPSCPPDWVVVSRPTEGISICYPTTWVVGSHGFVSSANESRWYALGLYDFADPDEQIQRAHVSVYAFPKFSRPVRYILDCPSDLVSVTLAGEPALVCQDYPGTEPEAEITSYHVFREGFDIFVNIVSYYSYEDGEYTDEVEEDARDVAIQVAQTLTFVPVLVFPETDTPTATPTPTP